MPSACACSSGAGGSSAAAAAGHNRQLSRCAIFWDIENCHVPRGAAGDVVVRRIRETLRQYGSITCFKAYFDSQIGSMAPLLRSQLQASGVSLIDVPHNGRKDAVDKMILVDMLAFAVDNPAPATVVLISGDSDFVYALSVLANRCYEVILITQHKSQSTQASVLLDWRLDVLQQESSEPQQPAMTTPVATSEPSSTSGGGVVVNSEARRSSFNLFEPLIGTLQELQAFNPYPRRSVVGHQLKKLWPKLYERSPDITNFSQYANEASAKGIVELGGESGYAWIRLKQTSTPSPVPLSLSTPAPVPPAPTQRPHLVDRALPLAARHDDCEQEDACALARFLENCSRTS